MTKRALISVSDKAGIVEFAQELKKLGWDIISTGGTKVTLDKAGVDTIAIETMLVLQLLLTQLTTMLF